jgi:hypothetical protein
MNERMKTLAEKAGFIFWGEEEWGHGSTSIDWSSDYTKEFNEYTKLLIEECVKVVQGKTSAEQLYGGYYHAGKILKHFGEEK